MAQSGARLVDVGTTNRTRLADYRRAVDRRDVAARPEGPPDQLPDRRASPRTRRSPSWPRSARPSSSTSAPACSTPRARGWPGRTRRRGWPASRPPARRSPPAPPSSRSAATSCSAARRPGSSPGGADLVAALRPPSAGPGPAPGRPGARRPAGRSPSPTCAATSSTHVPFWRDGRRRRSPTLRGPGDGDRRTAAGAAPSSTPTRCPGAGSAPGATIPSAGVRLRRRPPRRRCAPTTRRSSPGPTTGATVLDLRTVDPADDAVVARGTRDAAGARHRHRRSRRPRQVDARAGAHRHRPRPLRRGEAPRPHHRPRLRPHRRRGEAISFVDVPGHVRFLRNMLAGVGGVDACLFVVAATEGWKPQTEEHLRILELLGVRHGVVALTKVDVLDDDELVELAALEVADQRGRHVPRRRADRARRRAARSRASTSSPARSTSSPGATPAARRPGPAPAVDRPGVRGEGQRHRRDRHAHRRHRRRRATTSSSSRGGREARVRGAPDARHGRRRDRARPPRRAQPDRRRPRRAGARRRRRPRPASGTRPRASTPRSHVLGVARPRRVPARRVPRLRRLRRAPGAAAGARPDVDRARRRRRSCGCTCPSPCRCCPATASCCARAAATRPSAAARCSTSPRSVPASRARTGPSRRPGRRRAGLGRRRRARAADGRAARADGRAVGRRPPTSRPTRRPIRRSGSTPPARSASTSPRSTTATGRVLATLDDVVVDGDDGPLGRRRPTRSPTTRRRRARRRRAWRPSRPTASSGPSCASWPARGVVVERDGLWWHADAVGGRRPPSPPTCSPQRPAGFTVGEFREAAGITRKYAAAAAGRARQPGDHPPPRRPPHRREAAPDRSRRPDRAGRDRTGSEPGRGSGRDAAAAARSSWLRPPQMP